MSLDNSKYKVTTVKMVYATQVINTGGSDYPSPSQYEQWNLNSRVKSNQSEPLLKIPPKIETTDYDDVRRTSHSRRRSNSIPIRSSFETIEAVPEVPEREIIDERMKRGHSEQPQPVTRPGNIVRSHSERPKVCDSKPNVLRCDSAEPNLIKSSTTSLASIASDIVVVSAGWFSSLRRPGKKRRKREIQSSGKAKSAWDLSNLGKMQLKDELREVVSEMENMDTPDESKNNTKTKQMSIGRKKFNMDPKKGIEYLQEHGLLQNTPEDVAAYLYKGEGLNKTAIGDYLGEKNPFNEKVLKAFVELHDFTDLILVQALRQFLWSFRLPGEAQKIDRMMECFAQRYCQLNPNIFTNPDTCYVLSFAVIMLNTSLHNPSVKDKPTAEQFISMNRGINNGGDLNRELLISLYESIKTEPFKIPEDDGNDLMHTFFNPDKEGWLWKQGGRYKSWKRRWFILNDNCLYYFEYTTDKEPRGIIPLENIQVREASDRHKPHCFELYATGTDFIKACKTDSEGKVVEGKHTVYRMSAATADEKEDWIKCVRQSISHNPFYDMLAVRKKKAQKTNAHHHLTNS